MSESLREYIPKLHHIGLGQDTLDGPSRQLAAVVLHLSGHNSTALGDKLGPPVQRTAATLSLAVKLVERMHSDKLVLSADGVLLDCINLRAHNKVDGVLVGGRQVESPVLVGLGRRGRRLLGGVVEGVLVCHLDLLSLVLQHNLVREVVVDICSLVRKSTGLVDAILRALRSLQRRIGSVLVDCDHVESSIVALVEEDLVALADNDDIPRVDGAGRAHEHGQDVVGGEDGGLVLLGQLLDDRVGRGCDVVGSAVESGQLALGSLYWLLVVAAVVVVEETIVVDVLTIVRLEVQLAEAVVINLLEQLPVGLDVNRSITIARRLVIVLPAEPASALCLASSATTPSTVVSAAILLATTTATGPLELLTSASSSVATTTALTAASSEDGTASETGLGRVSDVGNNREGGFVLGNWCGEERGRACSVDLLIY